MQRVMIAGALAALLAGVAQAQTDAAIAYTVEADDTIETIAGEYDVSVEDIMVTNGLETEEVEIGTVIYIPPAHASGYFDPDTGTYLIAPGDDLDSIAARFGTTVAAIQQANDLSGTTIDAGATLQIPE